MILLKSSALIKGLKPEILLGLIIVESIFSKYGIDVIITEGTGSVHMEGSLHYSGEAIDIRSKHIPGYIAKHALLMECRNALGRNFDMILEKENLETEHYHLEFDVK